MEAEQPPISPPTTTSSKGIFGTKIPATTAFAIGILLFLLPFAEVKCNDTTLARNTGLGIATGSKWKEVIGNNMFGTAAPRESTANYNTKKTDPNIYAIVALALGVIGFALALANSRVASTISLITGVLSAASLIGLLFDLKNKVKMPDMNALRNPESTTDFNTNLSLDFTPAFYIAIIAFLSAAVFSWMRVNKPTTT